MKVEAHAVEGGGEGGFTLFEVAFVLVLSVLMVLALHQTVSVSLQARRTADRKYEVSRMAEEYMIRLGQIQFGKSTDPTPTSAQLDELFDDDDDLGTITLHQVAVAPASQGHLFTTATPTLTGSWRVKVTNDINGDGDTLDAREGRNDLFRIEIWFQDRLTLTTMRAADPDFTTKDTVVGG